MKKLIIISIVLVVCAVIGISIISFIYVIGKSIHNIVSSGNSQSKAAAEYPKIIDAGIAGSYKIYYENKYKGKIEKIEDNKIYFMVDKKAKMLGGLTPFFKDVKDYEVVFDINTYKLEYDPMDKGYATTIDEDTGLAVVDKAGFVVTHITHYDGDYLNIDSKNIYSAGELEKMVGKYVRVDETLTENLDYDFSNKFLSFSSEEE